MRLSILIFANLWLSLAFHSSVSAAITFNSVDEFETDTEGWREGNASPNPPTWTGNPGWNGEAGYLISLSDGAGSGGRQQLWTSDSDWTGNYLSPTEGPAIAGVSYWADNRSGSATDLALRVAFDGPGGWFVSDAIVLEDQIPGTNEWTRHEFDFASSNFLWVGGSGGTQVFDDTLSDVTRFQLLHSVAFPTFAANGDVLRGESIVSDLRLDGFRAVAVPEPGSLAVVSLLGMGACLRRRRLCKKEG